MDLLGRKLGLNNGEAFNSLLAEIRKTIKNAREIPGLRKLANSLEINTNQLEKVAMDLGLKAGSENILNAFANAHPFLDVTGDTVMAWMLLWRSIVASGNLEMKVKKKNRAFYEGQLKSAQFFINSVLPVSLGKMNVILSNDTVVADITAPEFGG